VAFAGEEWAGQAYAFGQHYLEVGLTVGGAIHCGTGGQRAFFDRATR